jgi:hypothetical protein
VGAKRKGPSDIARRNLAHDLIATELGKLRVALHTEGIHCPKPISSKNTDNSVDGMLSYSERDGIPELTWRKFLDTVQKEAGFGGIPFLFEPPGHLWFTYRFRFFHPGELSDKRREWSKRRRYVARVAAQRVGYFEHYNLGWFNADVYGEGRWIEGHEVARAAIPAYLVKYAGSELFQIALLVRWTPDGAIPSRALGG